MTAPYTTGQACQSTVLVANTAGTQICLTPTNQPAVPVVPTCSGHLHAINFGGDTTGETISVYDGTSTSGSLRFQGRTVAAGTPGHWIIDVQFYIGMFIVIAGGTTVSVTVVWE